MCEPVTLLAGSSIAMSAGGMAFSVMGQAAQADAAQKQANYQAQVASNNAIIAQQNADTAVQQGEAQVQANQRKTAAIIGSQRAALSANGVDANSGSALDVQSSAAEMGELDNLSIRYNAQMAARNNIIQGQGYAAQSQLAKMQGQSAQTAAGYGMASTLLSGGSSLAGKFGQLMEKD